MFEFLLAGHDTTAYSIAWILIELARNPPEQKKLRDELSQLSPEEWNKSEHLKMVIKEGMQLHPVASAGSLRKIGRDIITPKKDELILKGSICFCPFILLFRNPDIFPDRTCSIRGVGRTQLETTCPVAVGCAQSLL